MNIIVSFDCKFKTNKENIEVILQHYGLKKIQNTLYIGEMNNNEKKELVKMLNEITHEKDSVFIIPICENCIAKKSTLGRKIKFKNDLFRVY